MWAEGTGELVVVEVGGGFVGAVVRAKAALQESLCRLETVVWMRRSEGRAMRPWDKVGRPNR